jgi:energy-coupling factor transporter ATP-binding protein EcfA2
MPVTLPLRKATTGNTLPAKSLVIENLTVFSNARLNFSKDVNIIVGENASGKTHLLKLLYCIMGVMSLTSLPRQTPSAPTKVMLQGRIANKLTNVFRPESLGRLARRQPGRQRCDVTVKFAPRDQTISFSFATNSKSEVSIEEVPAKWLDSSAAYLPTRELLSIYPGFVSIYESHLLEFEETWRDTCVLLGLPLQRGPKEPRIRELLEPLERAMGGTIESDKNGRFYLKTDSGRMEMPLVAEGLRKLGMVARLIATGALLDNGYLFWDEPEAGLNPRLIKQVARTILDLGSNGIQVFVATHSLFLMREFEILLAEEGSKLAPHFFGLHPKGDAVEIQEGPTISDIGAIVSLEEDLQQSDRFLDVNA